MLAILRAPVAKPGWGPASRRLVIAVLPGADPRLQMAAIRTLRKYVLGIK